MFPDNCKSPLIGRFNYLRLRPLARHSGAQLHGKSNYFPASSSSSFTVLRVFPCSSSPSLIKSRQTGSRYWEYLQMPQTPALARCFSLLYMRATSISFSLLLTFSAPSLPVISKLHVIIVVLFSSLATPAVLFTRGNVSSAGAQGQMWKNMRLRELFFTVWLHLLPRYLNVSHLNVKPLHYGVRIKALLLMLSRATRQAAKVVNLGPG